MKAIFAHRKAIEIRDLAKSAAAKPYWRCVCWAAVLACLVLCLQTAASARTGENGRIARDGFDLYYHTVGHGELLVLLSGGPGVDVDILLPVAEELGRDHECILLEQRGTGRSKLKSITAATVNLSLYIDDLEALREHLGAEKLTFLGNSWGMLLALAYGTEHPDRVRGIITMGSGSISYEYFTVFTDNVHSRLRPAEVAAVDRAEHMKDRGLGASERLRAIVPAYFYDYDRGLRYAETMKFGGTDGDINLLVMGALYRERLDLRPGLRRLTAPVLLLQGRQDPAGEANLYEAHEALVGSRLVFLEKCGHFPWIEQPERFYRACRQFLDDLDHGVRPAAGSAEIVAVKGSGR